MPPLPGKCRIEAVELMAQERKRARVAMSVHDAGRRAAVEAAAAAAAAAGSAPDTRPTVVDTVARVISGARSDEPIEDKCARRSAVL